MPRPAELVPPFLVIPLRHAALIVAGNLPFARWGDMFGHLIIASAMIDSIVRRPDVVELKGNSYRLKKPTPRRN